MNVLRINTLRCVTFRRRHSLSSDLYPDNFSVFLFSPRIYAKKSHDSDKLRGVITHVRVLPDILRMVFFLVKKVIVSAGTADIRICMETRKYQAQFSFVEKYRNKRVLYFSSIFLEFHYE